jgi:uncharacterized protein YjbI with pentapeptide repeats
MFNIRIRRKQVRCEAWLFLFVALLAAPAALAGEDYSGKNLTKRVFDDKALDGANFEDAVLTGAHFQHASLKGANFKEADVTDAWFTGADLTNADFTNAIMGKFTYFAESNLNGAKMAGIEFKGGQFYNCKMQGTDLRNTKGLRDLRGVDMRGADLRGANLIKGTEPAGIDGIKLKGAKYDSRTRWPEGFDVEGSGAVLVEGKDETTSSSRTRSFDVDDTTELIRVSNEAAAPSRPNRGMDYHGKSLPQHSFVDDMLDNANFEGAQLASANFTNATLKQANFKNADLTRANFGKANLTGADFDGANLERARFVDADLTKAHLPGAKLTLAGSSAHAADLNKIKDNLPFSVGLNQVTDLSNGSLKFHGADLKNAKVEGNLEGVDFRRADLRGADFSLAERLDAERFRGAMVDRTTRFPSHFAADSAGLVQGPELANSGGPAAAGSESPLAGRWITRPEEGGSDIGILEINGDNTYMWIYGENTPAAHGKWRASTAADGGTGGIVLPQGEQGVDWVVTPSGSADKITLRSTTKKLVRTGSRSTKE